MSSIDRDRLTPKTTYYPASQKYTPQPRKELPWAPPTPPTAGDMQRAQTNKLMWNNQFNKGMNPGPTPPWASTPTMVQGPDYPSPGPYMRPVPPPLPPSNVLIPAPNAPRVLPLEPSSTTTTGGTTSQATPPPSTGPTFDPVRRSSIGGVSPIKGNLQKHLD